MGLPVTIAALILLIAGLSILLTGLFLRHGTRPSCRACGYDLSALTPACCSECNADLSAQNAIRIGDRRKPLVRIGAAVAIFALAGLIYTFVHAPGLDQRKPLWLLRIELSLVNLKGQERIIDELQRRLSDPSTSRSEDHAIGDLALTRFIADTSNWDAYELLIDAVRARSIRPERADPFVRELLDRWPDRPIAADPRSSMSDHELHADVLGSLLIDHQIEFEPIRHVLDRCLDRRISGHFDPEFTLQSEEILRSWMRSPGAPASTTDDFLRQVYHDSPRLRLETQARVEGGGRLIPFELFIAAPPALTEEVVFVAVQPIRARIVRGDQVIQDETLRLGGTVMHIHGGQFPGFQTGGFGTGLVCEPLSPGSAKLLLDVRSVVVRGNPPPASTDLYPLFDPANGHILIARTVTLESKFDIFDPSGDERPDSVR